MDRRALKRMTQITAGAAVMLGLAAMPAHAASGTWSSGGVTGVHAQGTWKTEYSKFYFSGYVKDTACDGRNVKLNIRFVDNFGSVPVTYRSETKYNTSGCGTSANFSYNSYVPGHNISIRVQECVIGGGTLGTDRCGSWATVANATP